MDTRQCVPVLIALTVSCAAALHRGGEHASNGTRSNITRDDYVGSARCRPCHQAEYDEWLHSPMHRMTRIANEADIRAPFDPPSEFHFGDTVAYLSQRGSDRFVRLAIRDRPEATYRITRVIGGRYREDFAALHVASDAPGARIVGDPRDDVIMPISWIYSTHSWRYKGYSVQVPERPGMRAGPIWRTSCIFCHNTTPFFSSTFDSLLGPGAPVYQGQLRNNLLPPNRAWRIVATDGNGLRDALIDEVTRLRHRDFDASDDDQNALLLLAARTTLADYDASQLVEVGIGCESCHNGSRAHAEHGAPETFEVESTFLSERPAQAGAAPQTRAAWINHTCARCHTVLFSHYPYTWEGGLRDAPNPGGSTINSGEARDFLLGGCSTQLSCVSCHNPHALDSADDLHRLETPAGNALCISCHAQFSTEASQRTHTHHDPAGAGGVCINCHMPRKNMGLNYNLVRYHRIGSPNDPVRVENDRPLECALCHTDRSVASIVSTMEHWWPRRFDRGALRRLYGDDLDVNVLRATLERGRPHEQAVAVSVLGRERDATALPLIVEQANNPYPLVRYFALHAAGSIVGSLPDWDMNAPGTLLLDRARAWLRARDPNYGPPNAHVGTPGRESPSSEPIDD